MSTYHLITQVVLPYVGICFALGLAYSPFKAVSDSRMVSTASFLDKAQYYHKTDRRLVMHQLSCYDFADDCDSVLGV